MHSFLSELWFTSPGPSRGVQKHAQIQTVDFSTAFCSHGSWSFTPNLCPVQKIKTKFLVSPYFSLRNYCLILPPFLFTFRVALTVRNAIQPHEAGCLECCIAYGMLISCPNQLRTGSSAVFYWPRTQCKMADSNGYRERKSWKSCKVNLKVFLFPEAEWHSQQ